MTSENIQTSRDSDLKVKAHVKDHLLKNGEGVGALLEKDGNGVDDFFQQKIAAAKERADNCLKGFNEIENSSVELGQYITTLQAQTTKLISELEQVTDLSIGIVREVSTPESGMSFIGSDKNDKVPITIRDARLQRKYRDLGNVPQKAQDVPETTSTVAAGMLRGVLQIIKDCDDGTLKSRAVKEAVGLFKEYKKNIEKDKPRTQIDRNKILAQMNQEFRDVLKTNDLKINGKLLNSFSDNHLKVAMGHVRDLANLTDDRQSSIFTLTNIGASKTHISASTPFKPLSKELEDHYRGQKLKELVKTMNPILAHSLTWGGLVEKIMDGKHMIPSQLHFPGLRNAWEERSFVMDPEGKVEAERVTSRSATPADRNGKGSAEISKANLSHMKQLSGGESVLLDVTILNSNVSGILKGEKSIVKSVQKAVEDNKEHGEIKATLCSISMLDSGKAAHFSLISKGAREAAETINGGIVAQRRRQLITCKSGKDRTNAATTLSTLDSMDDVRGIDVEYAQSQIVIAAHGSALSAANGATIGINGTKSANALHGLNKDDCVLMKFKVGLVSDIADANHVEFASNNKPYLKTFRAANAISYGINCKIRRIDSSNSQAPHPRTPNVATGGNTSRIIKSDSQV